MMIIKIRSKSKADKVRKCNYKENNTSIDNFEPKEYEEKTTETKILYKTNLDENGKEVLNENLFKYRKKEFSNKQMRKTFTGNFYQRRGSQPKDNKQEIKPEDNKQEIKPEDKKQEIKPGENKTEIKPEDNKPEIKPEDNKIKAEGENEMKNEEKNNKKR